MSAPHDARHEELLRERITGARRDDDPEFARVIALCAPCREAWARTRRVLDGLSRAADDQRATFAAAAKERDAELDGLVAERLRSGAARAPRTRRSVDGRRWRWAFAAAAAALIAWAVIWRASQSEPTRRLLGKPLIELVRPLGEHDSFDEFAWRAALPEAGSFELWIWDDAQASTFTPALDPIRVRTDRWLPTAEQERALPDALRWEVRVLDGSASVIDVARGQARRSRAR